MRHVKLDMTLVPKRKSRIFRLPYSVFVNTLAWNRIFLGLEIELFSTPIKHTCPQEAVGRAKKNYTAAFSLLCCFLSKHCTLLNSFCWRK